MYVPWRVREYDRTCPAGHTWRVPAWAVHRRMRGLPLGPAPRMRDIPVAGGSQRSGRTHEVISANADLAEKAAVFKICPECGDERYRQRPIRG
jgi:hypothetical protein